MAEQWAIASPSSRRAVPGDDGLAAIERVPVQLHPARRVDLLAHLAGAFDLAEG